MKLRSGSSSGFTGSTTRRRRSAPPTESIILVILMLLASGCATKKDEPFETPTTTEQEIARAGTAAHGPIDAPDARLWSRDGLDAQPRIAMLQQRTPADLGYTPGTTIWREVDVDLSSPPFADTVSNRGASPTALLSALVPALPVVGELGVDVWEQTLRIWQDQNDDDEEDEAVGIVLRWGLKDDAIVGHDHRVHMRRSDHTWRVVRVEERFHCSRGVTADGLCV